MSARLDGAGKIRRLAVRVLQDEFRDFAGPDQDLMRAIGPLAYADGLPRENARTAHVRLVYLVRLWLHEMGNIDPRLLELVNLLHGYSNGGHHFAEGKWTTLAEVVAEIELAQRGGGGAR